MRSSNDDDLNKRFARTLAQYGWIDGKNALFEYRSTRGDPPQYEASAAELIGLHVDVIYANNAPAKRKHRTKWELEK